MILRTRNFECPLMWVWIFSVLSTDSGVRAGAGGPNDPGTSGIKPADSDFVPGTAEEDKISRVLLTIGARNLLDKDLASRSDPFCRVEMQKSGSEDWVPLGTTETAENNLNPNFSKTIEVDYHFEKSRPLRFLLYDQDPQKVDFLGFAYTKLETLVAANYKELILNVHEDELNLTDKEIDARKKERMQRKTSGVTGTVNRTLTRKPPPPSKVVIWVEEYRKGQQSAGANLVMMDVRGVELSVAGRVSWLGLSKPNPYIDIHKEMVNKENHFRLVFRSKEKRWSRNPHWRELVTLYSNLADENPNRRLKFVCYDSQARADHAYIGEFITTVAEIQNSQDKSFHLETSDEMKKKSSYYENHSPGKMKIRNFKILQSESFLKYVMGNLDINAIIGIDFTLSNGKPYESYSLHYIDRSSKPKLNEYEQAITSIVSIIEEYDTDKLFPTFGYGAKLRSSKQEVYHVFPVNMNERNPNCKKVDGVLEAYRRCLSQIDFWQPTWFAPIINYAVKTTRAYKKGKFYAILLIITDGQIMDLAETEKAIIKGSDLPLSIIIVGVGDYDFKEMDALDSDEGLLQHGNMVAKRDIVQFVPFKKLYGAGGESDKDRLAQEVLAEVPKQLVEYMATHKLMPKRKKAAIPAKPVHVPIKTPPNPQTQGPPKSEDQSKPTSSTGFLNPSSSSG